MGRKVFLSYIAMVKQLKVFTLPLISLPVSRIILVLFSRYFRNCNVAKLKARPNVNGGCHSHPGNGTKKGQSVKDIVQQRPLSTVLQKTTIEMIA